MGGCDLGVVKLIFACSISGSSIVSIFPSNFACKLLFYLVNALVFSMGKKYEAYYFYTSKNATWGSEVTGGHWDNFCSQKRQRNLISLCNHRSSIKFLFQHTKILAREENDSRRKIIEVIHVQ